LVFSLASGDIRTAHNLSRQLDFEQVFRAMHDMSVGLRQLHTAQIAHQDIKPSNVLTFDEARQVARLGDLGRASLPAGGMEHDEYPFAGDCAYAAPEGLYGSGPPVWDGRRAHDLYHLGSMLHFMLTGTRATAAWLTYMHPLHIPSSLGGPYDGTYADVLPFVRDAVDKVAEDFPDLGDEVITVDAVRNFRELCEPDPLLRGHPKARSGSGDQYSIERYVASFDLMSRRATRGIRRQMETS
jgi:serine/threonine protein kinase